MADYREQSIQGVMRRRCNAVQISNEMNATPSARFVEEDVIDVGTGIVKTSAGVIVEQLTDPTVVFNMLNPLDGSLIGQASYGEAYALLYSLYIHVAAKRDAAESA